MKSGGIYTSQKPPISRTVAQSSQKVSTNKKAGKHQTYSEQQQRHKHKSKSRKRQQSHEAEPSAEEVHQRRHHHGKSKTR